MKLTEQYRQGDVFIERIAEIPATAEKQETSRRMVLAHGEMTGHHHVLETSDPADWWKPGKISITNPIPAPVTGELYVSLPQSATVTHPEHATIQLPRGNYRMTRQREYSPQEIRRVND